MKKVVALIPIKLNNQRLPGKNLKMLGGKALCQYLFDTVKTVQNIDEVYVYCSDESIKKYIPNELKFLKRSSELDSDITKSKDILNAFIETVYADVYVLMHVTQPFIKKDTIEIAVDHVVNGEYDSAFVAHEIREFTWYKGSPLNYSFNNVVRTQELEPTYTEGELFVFEREVFTNKGRRIGEHPWIQSIGWEENICIDTPEDFDMAKCVIAMREMLDEKK
jgi:CMP-N-acetylneuraminic acid synthetase